MKSKKKFKKSLCVFIAATNIFSVITPNVFAVDEFLQRNGCRGLVLTSEDDSAAIKLLEEKNANKGARYPDVNIKSLWAENVGIRICLGQNPKEYAVLVPKYTSVRDAINELDPDVLSRS
ncbi:hypothetical protein FACS1894198_5850 [Clostridia bacterium]|nr:hypothetical protein FACS1894198_5850 [Clostridia bacterium]